MVGHCDHSPQAQKKGSHTVYEAYVHLRSALFRVIMQ